jgi:hypothetical protein
VNLEPPGKRHGQGFGVSGDCGPDIRRAPDGIQDVADQVHVQISSRAIFLMAVRANCTESDEPDNV